MNKVAAAKEPAFSMSRDDRDEYRTWAEQQPAGRFERVNGVVVAMAPERVNRNQRKALAWLTLRRAVHAAGLPCEVFTLGITVEVGDSDDEPDAVVYCGAKLPGDAVAIPNPLIIVEVLSPSTSAADRAWKLLEYFKLTSLRHYLIIWADKPQILRHRRTDSGQIEARIVTVAPTAARLKRGSWPPVRSASTRPESPSPWTTFTLNSQ